MRAACLVHLIPFDLSNLILFGESLRAHSLLGHRMCAELHNATLSVVATQIT
jgi:hypothetical protein